MFSTIILNYLLANISAATYFESEIIVSDSLYLILTYKKKQKINSLC